MILRAESVFKTYPSSPTPLEILKGVSLDVGSAESVAIVGRSGSGKSTLLSLLAGLDSVTQGKISIENQDWSTMTEEISAKTRSETLGLIFQQFHLLPHLTARENIRLPLELTRQASSSTRKVEEALTNVGLTSRGHHYPHELSRGECQRVAIARALVLEPKVLLADEPTASLDDETSQSVGSLLFELPQRLGTALVIATHDLDIARKCRRIYRISHGLLSPVESV